MNHLVLTNVEVYRTIADEAYKKMVQSVEAGRRPKADGTAGWIRPMTQSKPVSNKR